MKPGSLLLALGSLVLWASLPLLGAPLKSRCLLKCQRNEDCPVGHTCGSFRGKLLCRPIAAVAAAPGTPSPTHGSHTGLPQSSGAHPKGETTSEPPLLDASLGDVQLSQNHSVPMRTPERVNGTGETLLPKETAPVPFRKPLYNKKPHPEVSTEEDGPVGVPRGEVLGSEPDEGVRKASEGREETLAKDNSTGLSSTEGVSTSDEVHLIHESAPPGNKPSGGSGSASSSPSRKPPLAEKPGSHVAHGSPVPSGKPALDGKPTPALGNRPQGSPSAGSKPTPHSGEGVHKETAPHEKPETAGKPAPDKKPEPADETKDGGDDSSTEGIEEEDEEEGEGGKPGGEGDEGDSDAFDKELDYGLDSSPFNAYEYHDAWSDGGSDDPEEWLDAGPAEDATGLGDWDPVFDVWGDRVVGRGSETSWFPQQPNPVV